MVLYMVIQLISEVFFVGFLSGGHRPLHGKDPTFSRGEGVDQASVSSGYRN